MQQYPQNTQPPYSQNTHPPFSQDMQGQQRQQYKYNFTEKQMRRYFYPASKVFLWILLAGGAFLVMGVLIGSTIGAMNALVGAGIASPFFFVGVPLVCVGGIPLYIHYTQRPTPDQYTGWVLERSQSLYKTAFQRLHLDESQCQSVVEVQGGISSLLQLTKKFPEKEIVVKRTPNGFRHYSINTSMYILLTEDAIAIYSGFINALSQHERFEDAGRYYYKDITAVTTSGPVFLYWDGALEKEIQMQGFLVSANNGDVVGTDYATRVILRDGEKRERLQGVDEVVPALLHFLQDHKASLVAASVAARNIR